MNERQKIAELDGRVKELELHIMVLQQGMLKIADLLVGQSEINNHVTQFAQKINEKL